MPPKIKPEKDRFQLSLSQTQKELLVERTEIEGLTGSEVLRRALEVYSWIRDEQAAGRRIVSVNAGGREPKELRVV